MEAFGERLRQERERRRWSIQELVAQSGVPYMTIYRLETRAGREPMLSTGVKLALALDVSLYWLAGVYEKESHRDL